MAAATISQLNAARHLALGDSVAYPQIIRGILPIIGATAVLELRRWGADFLAESFSSPVLPESQKQVLGLEVLDVLKEYLEIPGEDTGVVKSVVGTITSIYPGAFKEIIYNPASSHWQTMAAIKSNILRRMDSAPPGVQACCIKFIARVIQLQTPGMITDPRRPESNELSLALVPRDHPTIPPPNLEAEALGLLDRLLGVFQESTSDALHITATLNSLSVLVQTRPAIASRILSAVLNFNPFKVPAGNSWTPHVRVAMKSMERTTRMFLSNFMKRNHGHPLTLRIHGYLERLQQSRHELLDDANRKRAAPVEPTDGLDSAKRQRLGAELSPVEPATAPIGPMSIAEMFTLTQDEKLRSFDASSVPIDLVAKIVVPLLQHTDRIALDKAVNTVRLRWLVLSQQAQAQAQAQARQPAATNAPLAPPPIEDAEQFIQRLESAPEGLGVERLVETGKAPLIIPQPPPMTSYQIAEYGQGMIARVFGIVNGLEDPSTVKATKQGFNRLAASNYDRDSWVTVVVRLATRTLSGLETKSTTMKQEHERKVANKPFSVGDAIRESLYAFVLEDFRRRMDVAVSWLNEEWYNDIVQAQTDEEPVEQFDKWSMKLLDGIVPYLDSKDKVLIRFLSEIPKITPPLLERVKKLAQDPEHVSLAVNAIHYLVLYRPPVRDMCLNALEDLWRNYEDAKTAAAKVLTKWRPQVLQSDSAEGKPAINTSGTALTA